MKFFGLSVILSLLLSGCGPSKLVGNKTADSGKTNTLQATGIVGGTEVKQGSKELFSTVGLYDQKTKALCTGTLINDNLVLTAAHCVGDDPTAMVVIFKEKFKDAEDQDVRDVIAAKKHEQYVSLQFENSADIAVIKFDVGDGLPPGYGTAKLLPDFSILQKGTSIVAVGYGLSRTWIFQTGSGVVRTTELKIEDPNFSKTEILVDQSLKRGVCSGDSGGPGYMKVNGELYLWGVVSRGDKLRIPLTPKCFMFSVYTRVDAFADWIAQATKELQ